jgi:Fic family protein
MNEIIYIIIGLVVGGVVGFLIGRKGGQKRLEQKHEFNEMNERRAEERQKHLDQIMAIFNPGDEITNDKVEHLLHISDTSAERYLDELEKQGKLTQVGKTGKYVIYKKV